MMNLFNDIQSSVLQENPNLGGVLLKLKLLAKHLGSEPLAQWIIQELEGYTNDDTVPPYRVVDVTYRGTFSGPYGSGLPDVPIPMALIEKFAGKDRTQYRMIENIRAIGDMERGSRSDGGLQFDDTNLILLLQGKVYPRLTCNSVVGIISRAEIVGILDVVRSRIIDLTSAIEKANPNVREICLSDAPVHNDSMVTKTNKVVYQTIYGDVTNNFQFESDLKDIILEHIRASNAKEPEKKKMMETVKHTGVQELVKTVLREVSKEALRVIAG